jgi:hypothetical protein
MMQRIDSLNNVPELPAPGEAASDPGFFSDGDQETERPGTVVLAWWLNAVQEEICSFIVQSGLTLDKTKHDQLIEAVKKYIAASPTADLAQKGVNDAATADGKAVAAQQTADSATYLIATLNTAMEVLQNAVAGAVSSANSAYQLANQATGIFIDIAEAVDANEYYYVSLRLRPIGTISNFPVGLSAPLFFQVMINDANTAITQVCWDSTGKWEYRRTATVDISDPDNQVATWGIWSRVAGPIIRDVVDTTTGLPANTVITLSSSYTVGSGKLWVYWNGFICWPGRQYNEVGTAGQLSNQITVIEAISASDDYFYSISG